MNTDCQNLDRINRIDRILPAGRKPEAISHRLRRGGQRDRFFLTMAINMAIILESSYCAAKGDKNHGRSVYDS